MRDEGLADHNEGCTYAEDEPYSRDDKTYLNLTQWYESVTLELGNVDETGIIEYLEIIYNF